MRHITKSVFTAVIAAGMALVASSNAFAIPSLQLGPGSGTWAYDIGTDTFATGDNPFNMNAFANATSANGGNGDFAWDAAGAGALALFGLGLVGLGIILRRRRED